MNELTILKIKLPEGLRADQISFFERVMKNEGLLNMGSHYAVLAPAKYFDKKNQLKQDLENLGIEGFDIDPVGIAY